MIAISKKIIRQFGKILCVFLLAAGLSLISSKVAMAALTCDSGTLSDTCTVTASNTMNDGDVITGSGNLVIASGGAITSAAGNRFGINMGGNITIQSGGTITGNLSGATSTNFTIDSGGSINVNSLGFSGGTYASGSGTGGGTGSGLNLYPGGGGYGGNGGSGRENSGGIANGSIYYPADLGSGGGGMNTASAGGPGGGVVKLITSGILTINGTITASGGDGVTGSNGNVTAGGSGGSIWLQTATLAGAGSITANGGAGVGNAGGGGGGRIAISYTTDSSVIIKQAYGGTGYQEGGAGTIYTKAGSANGDVVVDNNTITASNAGTSFADASYILANLTLKNGGYISLGTSNTSFTTANFYSTASTTRFIVGTNTVFTATIFSVTFGTLTFDVPKNISTLPTATTFTIDSGASLTHSANSGTHTYSLLLNVAGNATITGSINVNSLGFSGGTYASGSGTGGGTGSNSNSYPGGGGYGGIGGDGKQYSGGITYGSSTQPTDIGSGGGGMNTTSAGGPGGGALKLVVAGTLTLNGTITASGGDGVTGSNGNVTAGGSGGSIWLQTATLAGAGSITANGGAGVGNAGGGGGGRIAISYTTDSSTITKQAAGGVGYDTGDAGTITTGYTYGELISSRYDSNSDTNILKSISWSETIPSGGDVKFQLRTSPDNVTWTDWFGPGGTNTSYFTNPAGGETMPAVFTSGGNDRWFQYKVILSSLDLSTTPTVDNVSIEYIANMAPEARYVTASQGSNGVVTVTYQMRDTDTAEGALTNRYKATTTLQYCTASCSNVGNETWADAAAVTGDVGAALAIAADWSSTKTIYWTASSDYASQFNATNFKIRIKLNDNEDANNTDYEESAVFTLDTTVPVLGAHPLLVNATTTPATLTLSATDSSALYMKISLNSNLSGAETLPYAATSSITLASDPDTVYAQFIDAYGNATAIQSATTPDQPTNVMIQDTSNTLVSPIEYRLFTAWKVVANPGPGFGFYEIYSSPDQSIWTLVATSSGRLINYYGDSTAPANTIHYYRVTAVDADGSRSSYSSIVHGIANGAQDSGEGGGGSAIGPVISNVATSSVSTAQTTITWNTDLLSNSQVLYLTSTGGDFSSAPMAGSATMANTAAGVGAHSITLSDLTPATTYYFSVKSTDANDNTASSTYGTDGYMFATLAGPVISAVATSSLSNTAVTITWTTTEASDSSVYYSTSASLTNPTEISQSDSTSSHTINLTGLTMGTNYYFYVKSGVATDNHGGAYYNFRTTIDTTAPTISSVAAIASTTGATISWTTNELANSKVQYGLTTGYGAEAISNDLTLDHVKAITGLTPASAYHYRVVSIDANNNSATSSDYSFSSADNVAPVITGVATSSISLTGATITWTTNENANSLVDYGTAVDSLTELAGQVTDSATAHTVVLSGLSAHVKYYFRVRSQDNFGNLATDNNGGTYYNFTTTADTTAPTISRVSASPVYDTVAVITWETSELSDSRIQYGLTNALGASQTAATSTYLHNLPLTGLTAKTTYYYQVLSADSSSNTASSSIGTFTTQETLTQETQVQAREATARAEGAATPTTGGGVLYVTSSGSTIDRTAPVISAINILNIKTDSAAVSWKTDKSSDSLVEYGLTSNYDEIEGKRTPPTTEHQVKLKRLDPDTLYNYRLSSVDANGNLAQSANQVFKTASVLSQLDAEAQKVKDIEQMSNAQNKESAITSAANTAMDIISQAAKQVSITSLESTLNNQFDFIAKLAASIPAPLLSGEPRVITTAYTATVAWRTNKEANSLVAYSPEESFKASASGESFSQVVGDAEAQTTNHVVNVNELKPDTTYIYQVRSKSPIGPSAKSSNFTFHTQKEALEISSYVIQNVSNEKAVFKWITNIETDATLKYIPYRKNVLAVDEAKTKTDKDFSLIHEITVDDLEAGTVYQVELSGQDQKGDNTSKVIPTFATSNDDLPPVIYQVQSSSAINQGKTDTIQTVISWMTNEPSTSKVYYTKGLGRETDQFQSSSQLDLNYTKKHIVIITKLEPGAIYRFMVESVDSTSNTTLSKVFTILTPRKQETVFDVIKKNFVDVFGWTSRVGK